VGREIGDVKGIARALGGLGVVAMSQSRYEDAWQVGEQSLAAYEQLGEKRGVAMALHNLATIEWCLGRGDLGRARFESALAMLRELGDTVTEALCLSAVAMSLVRLGEPKLAQARLREACALLGRLETPREAVYLLEALADWLFAAGRPADGARFLAAAASARAAVGLPFMPHEANDVGVLAARTREAIGDSEWARQQEAGGRLALTDALVEGGALANSVQ
jgi:tetratricopeptide (TPR) repeat protein